MAEKIEYVGLDDNDAVAEEQIQAVEELVEQEGNHTPSARERELEKRIADLQSKQGEREKFWAGGNWQEMPDGQMFYLTILQDKNSPAKSKFPVILGNAHKVEEYEFKKGEALKVRKEVVRVVERAKVDDWYPEPNERGERILVHTFAPRFEYRVLPAWD